MSTCRGCGGVVGRDCWNPQECEWISRDMERRHHEDVGRHEAAGEIATLRARLAEVEAERDAAITGSREIRGALLAAEARLAEVEAERDIAREHSLNRLAANIDLRARAEAAEARLAAVELAGIDDDNCGACARVRAALDGEEPR